MPVTLTIRNVPESIADALRRRAQKAHRSLQGELLHVLEESVRGKETLTIREVRERVAGYGIGTDEEESVRMIREDRDAR